VYNPLVVEFSAFY